MSKSEPALGELTVCGDCGMVCEPGEYHPYAACLMFKACWNGRVVRANLQAVLDRGATESQRLQARESDDG